MLPEVGERHFCSNFPSTETHQQGKIQYLLTCFLRPSFMETVLLGKSLKIMVLFSLICSNLIRIYCLLQALLVYVLLYQTRAKHLKHPGPLHTLSLQSVLKSFFLLPSCSLVTTDKLQSLYWNMKRLNSPLTVPQRASNWALLTTLAHYTHINGQCWAPSAEPNKFKEKNEEEWKIVPSSTV